MYNNDEMYSADSGAMMDEEIYNATKRFNLDTAGLSPSSSKYIALKNRYQEKIAAIKRRYGNFGFDYETDSFNGDDEMFSADSGSMDKEIYYATKEFNTNTAGLTPSSPKYMAYKEQYQRKIAAIKKRYGSFNGDDEMFSADSGSMDKEIYYATKEFNTNTAGLTPSSPKYMAYKEQYQRKIAAIKKRYGSFDGNDEMFSADSGEMEKLIADLTKRFNIATAGLSTSSKRYIALKKRYEDKIAIIKKRYGSFDGDYSLFSSVTPQLSNEDADFAFNGIEF